MAGRVHVPEKLRAANTASSHGSLLLPRGVGTASVGSSGGDQFALAQNALQRQRRKRLALVLREAEAPVETAIDAMVQAMRVGRLPISDVRATQQRELDRLQGLKVLGGPAQEIADLESATAIRRAALGRLRDDLYLSVNYPGAFQ